MNLWGRGRVLGHSLVAVLADDEPAVLLATLIHNLGVLLIGNLRRRGRRRGAVRGSARGGKYLKFPMRSERLREAGNWGLEEPGTAYRAIGESIAVTIAAIGSTRRAGART